jgi:hypothetical protein
VISGVKVVGLEQLPKKIEPIHIPYLNLEVNPTLYRPKHKKADFRNNP